MDNKIFTLERLRYVSAFWRTVGDRITFTNGCFDLLHPGHIHLLRSCAQAADRLVIGLNSDASVQRLKGKDRPLNKQQFRLQMLAALTFTDAVVLFEEDTPEKLIRTLKPDVLVKGGDWEKDKIVGADFVANYGGTVLTIPYMEGYSTTAMIAQIKNRQ